MRFKQFFSLTEHHSGAGGKLGLYPTLYVWTSKYPPLYSVPRAADFITYFDMEGGKVKSIRPGIIDPGPRVPKFKY
jgi:hypothetical protein